MYPKDCVQSILSNSDWWEKNEDRKLCRGAIVIAFALHFDQTPLTFEPIGRADAERHDEAKIKVGPLKVDQPLKKTNLPVAAMPQHGSEVWVANRAKRRPCLVVGSASKSVNSGLTKGMPNNSTAPTIHVAPYYGVDRDGTRVGYKPEFVERVRHCEYPQFLWDCLPIKGPKESILRLDHIQPIGAHYHSYKVSEYKLSEDALMIVDELITNLVWGGVDEESLIALYRQEIEDTFGE